MDGKRYRLVEGDRMKKHAYLIMAHNNFEQLKTELKLLDDVRNDIYIHVDKKAKKVNLNEIKNCVRKSKVYFARRHNVKWAGYSGIQCELELLKMATAKQKYQYYHLLSGMDLPLKNQDDIHHFFEQNEGKEFVSFDREMVQPYAKERIQYYYFFQNIYGRNRKNPFLVFLFLIDKVLIRLQKAMKVNRIKNENVELQKGANWFSITHSFAEYVLEKENWIKKVFQFSRSGDEIFLQTILINSDFRSKLYQNGLKDACLRKIDWGRGKPYIWRAKDYCELVNSNLLFARKFDENIDNEIIRLISEKK